jgi:methyltransferase (TIGR00027 family)
LPIIQDKKKIIIKKCLGELPSNIIYTPIDFNIQSLDEVLSVKGLDLEKPIFFIWEGVTQYITQEAVENTLKFISRASFGSKVLFSYIIRSVKDGTSSIGTDFLMDFFKSWTLF